MQPAPLHPVPSAQSAALRVKRGHIPQKQRRTSDPSLVAATAHQSTGQQGHLRGRTGGNARGGMAVCVLLGSQETRTLRRPSAPWEEPGPLPAQSHDASAGARGLPFGLTPPPPPRHLPGFPCFCRCMAGPCVLMPCCNGACWVWSWRFSH